MTAPPLELCQHCDRAIELVDSPGANYSHRHVASKRICCRSVYEPEIATPASQPTKEN